MSIKLDITGGYTPKQVIDLDITGIPTTREVEVEGESGWGFDSYTEEVALTQEQREKLWVYKFKSWINGWTVSDNTRMAIMQQAVILTDWHDEELLEELGEALQDSNPKVQKAAADALLSYNPYGDRLGMDLVYAGLEGDDESVQYACAVALRNQASTVHKDWEFRDNALDVVETYETPETTKLVLCQALIKAGFKGGERVAYQLRCLLRSESRTTQLATIKAMGGMRGVTGGQACALSLYHVAMYNSDEELVDEAFKSMSSIGRYAISLLAKYAREDENQPERRAKAIRALVDMRFKFHPEDGVAAQYCLEKIDDAIHLGLADKALCVRNESRRGAQLMENYLNESDKNSAVTLTNVDNDAIAKAREAQVLYDALFDSDDTVVLSAIQSIGKRHLDVPKLRKALRLIATKSDNFYWRDQAKKALYGRTETQAKQPLRCS